jgi:K(+)-stimulated pyrophosphate-energized sodium pump
LVLIVSILLGYSGTLVENSSVFIGVSFLIGAFISAFAGYIGMNIATKSNVRTTQAARTSLTKALEVSFTGGSVMGIGVASLAVSAWAACLSLLYHVFRR